MTQYTYHSGPLAEVKVIVSAGHSRTVVVTYKPPIPAEIQRSPGAVVTRDPLAVPTVAMPATVEIKFENGTTRSFNAQTGEWLSEMTQGNKQHGHASPDATKRNPDS